jgi:raffinose/stachyose/melibiose transport system permease protein
MKCDSLPAPGAAPAFNRILEAVLKHVVNTVRPWQLLLFLAPALIVYGMFSALPLVQTLGQGFFSADDGGNASFVGLENFRTVLLDPDWSAGFWNAMANNAKFFCVHMLLQNPVGLLLATLFSLKGLRGARTYRTLIFCRRCCRW